MDLDNVYITSDLHFWHRNICKYCENSRGRWFTEDGSKLAEMNEYILKQFDTLPAGCTVINLGDIYLNGSKGFDDIKVLVDRMKANGKKLWLVLGNHDRTVGRYMKDRRGQSAVDIYREMGFDRVFEFPIMIDDTHLLSHEPVYLGLNSPIKNLFGHVHDTDIDVDYFNRECENWAMMQRVKQHPELTAQKNLDINTDVTRNDKTINLKNYVNVCWDKLQNIVPIKEVM